MRSRVHGKRRKTSRKRCGFPPSARVPNTLALHDLEEFVAAASRPRPGPSPVQEQELAAWERDRHLAAVASAIIDRVAWDAEGRPERATIRVTHVPDGAGHVLRPGQISASDLAELSSRVGGLRDRMSSRSPAEASAAFDEAAAISVANHPSSARRASAALARFVAEAELYERALKDPYWRKMYWSGFRPTDVEGLPPGPIRDEILSQLRSAHPQPGHVEWIRLLRDTANIARNSYERLARPGRHPKPDRALLDLASALHEDWRPRPAPDGDVDPFVGAGVTEVRTTPDGRRYDFNVPFASLPLDVQQQGLSVAEEIFYGAFADDLRGSDLRHALADVARRAGIATGWADAGGAGPQEDDGALRAAEVRRTTLGVGVGEVLGMMQEGLLSRDEAASVLVEKVGVLGPRRITMLLDDPSLMEDDFPL